jgi:hypothetical protein
MLNTLRLQSTPNQGQSNGCRPKRRCYCCCCCCYPYPCCWCCPMRWQRLYAGAGTLVLVLPDAGICSVAGPCGRTCHVCSGVVKWVEGSYRTGYTVCSQQRKSGALGILSGTQNGCCRVRQCRAPSILGRCMCGAYIWSAPSASGRLRVAGSASSWTCALLAAHKTTGL